MVTGEILPIYHDRFQITNKTIVLVEKQNHISDSNATIIKGREYSSMFNDIRHEYMKTHTKENILECQNGIPIQIYKNFKRHSGNAEMIINDIKEGMVLKISGLGFLGDHVSILKVFLVTDRFAFLKDPVNEKVRCYSHKELERMQNSKALEVL